VSDTPVEVIVAAFKDEKGAENALQQLKQAKKEHLIDIANSAVLRRDGGGKLHISEAKDMGGGRGAVLGGAAGAVVGLLAGPLLLPIAGGALIGGLVAKLRDTGFSDERLRKLGEGLQPGTSALVAVVEHTWYTELQAELAKAGGDVVVEEMSKDIAAQLKEGGEVAYTALATADAVAASRVATGPERLEAGTVVATGEGVYAGSVAVVKDEVTVSEAVSTPEGAVGYVASGQLESGDTAKLADAGASEPAVGAQGATPAPPAPPAQASTEATEGSTTPAPSQGESKT
jgi:uncharacterized membrane protein